MRIIRLTSLAIPLVILLLATSGTSRSGPPFNPCASFFWTGDNVALVERYQPRYLLGLGLEDVGMGDIGGSAIRTKWSRQAAGCFASTNPNSYFSHPDFDRRPGGAGKRLAEKLQDMRDVQRYLRQDVDSAIYRQNLAQAREASVVFVRAMAGDVGSAMAFYGQRRQDHGVLIDTLSDLLDPEIPEPTRSDLLDELCSAKSVAALAEAAQVCLDQDRCELSMLYGTIDLCAQRHDGAALDELAPAITDNRRDLQKESSLLLAEINAISRLWTQLEALIQDGGE